MGGAVSSGRDNNELVDNLMSGNYIRSRSVERVFRVLDRADYMSPEARDQAYKDLAWRNGPLHLSAPCIYSEVMEALELRPGLSFLNVGSGTGYLSTLVGLIIGSSGISHGVEALPVVYEYANKKLGQFIENSITLDEFDFCVPKYYTGNGLCLAPTHTYDRVYCGAGVLAKHENYFKQLTKVGGVLVMPLADTLVQQRRVSDTHWSKRNLLNVSFALLREPDKDDRDDLLRLEEQAPASLQVLSRATIRLSMRAGLLRRHPDLREPPPAPRPAPRTAPRRICIPYDASDDDLNDLHDLDEAGGAHEMNALLSLVLSMGQNRAAGSLRLDPVDDIDDEYAEVGDLYALDEREDGSPPLMPDDGVIVFDVAPGGMRARRWQPRAPRDKAPTDQPGTSALVGEHSRTDTDRTQRTEVDAGNTARSETTAAVSETIAETSESTEPSTEASASGEASTEPSTSTEASAETSAKSKTGAKSPRAFTRRAEHLSRMLWYSSDSGDEDATQVKDNKRQKLDSGIGEGTASSGASPDKSDLSASAPYKPDQFDEDADMAWCDLGSDYTVSTTTSESESEGELDSDRGRVKDEPQVATGRCDVNKEVTLQLEQKRKKLDSGIGGEPNDDTKEEARGDGNKRPDEGRRRVQKRLRRRGVCPASGGGCRGTRGDTEGHSSGSDSGGEGGAAREAVEARRGAHASRERRRVQLSLAMKRAVKELPLPHALKKYVNLGRCYQF